MQVHNNITSQRLDRFTADAEGLPVKGRHRPKKKTGNHADCLAGSYRTVTDNGITITESRTVPPCRSKELPFTQPLVDHPYLHPPLWRVSIAL